MAEPKSYGSLVNQVNAEVANENPIGIVHFKQAQN